MTDYYSDNRMITMSNSIKATPDPSLKSQQKLLLKHGETVTQSDYHSNSVEYNAVKMFNNDMQSVWACNRKNLDNISSVDKVNRPFNTNPYKKVSTYVSQYQGGHATDIFRSFSTPTVNGHLFSGSWAQVTYPYAFYPGTMTIQVMQGVYNTERQRQVPKCVVFCVSEDDYNVDDVDKRWELLAEYDFRDKYATIIEFKYKGVYGKEYFSLTINDQLYSSYNCTTTEKSERIAVGGLDSVKIVFINKKDFASYGPLSKPGIVFTEFRVNGKPMQDNIVHETRNEKNAPVNGTLYAPGGYDLKAGFPGDADTPCFRPILCSSNKHLLYKPVRSIRMIIKELYGGEYFNIARWEINGDPIARGPNQTFDRPVSLLLEGFTNKQIISRPKVDNSIYNGLYTSTPQIQGVSLRAPLTIKEGFAVNSSEEDKNALFGDGGLGAANGPMEIEKDIVKALKEFNEAYYYYIHCNGLHLNETDRSIKSTKNPQGKCDPSVNYHRQIKKIIVKFKTGPTTNSGTNKFKSMQLIGVPDGESGVRPLGEPFTDVAKLVCAINTEYSYEYENEIDQNGDIIDNLGGLGAYKGTVTGLRMIFETSRLEFVKLKVTIFDSRGGTDPSNPDVPVAKYTLMNYDGAGFPIEETETEDDSGNRNSSVDVPGRTLYFYTDGFQTVNAKGSVLRTKLQELMTASSSITKKQTLDEYRNAHTAQEGLIERFKELRYELDAKMREIYKLKGTNAANAELSYNGTMFSGMLWTALTASILYYTFFEMDD